MIHPNEKPRYHKVSPPNPGVYDVWEWVNDQPLLNNGHARLLSICGKHMDLKTFMCHPSRGFIRDLTNWHENNVSRVKKDLEVLGYIKPVGRGKYQKIWVNYGFKLHHLKSAEILSLMDQLPKLKGKKQDQNDMETPEETEKQYQNDTKKDIKTATRNNQANSQGGSSNSRGIDQEQQDSASASLEARLTESEPPKEEPKSEAQRKAEFKANMDVVKAAIAKAAEAA